jgi:photosystem II stability/assembly factor-like uncharacterized protein
LARSVIALLLALVLAGCGGSQLSASSGSSGSGAGSSGAASNPNTSSTAKNHVHSIVIMPHDPNALYLGAHRRLYHSTDGGHTWHALTRQMMLAMAQNVVRPTVLYAVSLQHGFVRSTDGGATWKPVAGVPAGSITGVAVDPTGRIVLAYGNDLYRGSGAGWTKVLRGHSVASAAFGSGGSAYAATGDGLFVSRDGGLHWHLVGSIGNQPVVQVQAAGSAGYAVTALGVMRTINRGGSWTLLSKAPLGVEFLGVAPSDPNEVIGEVAGKGFYATYDGGATWHRAKGIHDTDFNASTIRIAPSNPNVAYTGAWGLHFYASHDGGRHWTETATLTK